MRRRNLKNGVEVPDTTWEALNEVAVGLGVRMPEV